MAAPLADWRVYRGLFDALPLLCAVVSGPGRLMWINAHGAAVNGARPRELIGELTAALWPYAAAERDKRRRQAARERKPVTAVAHGKLRDGAGVWLRRTWVPAQGGVLVVAEDVTASIVLRATDPLLTAIAPPSVRAALRGLVTGHLPPPLNQRVAAVLAGRPPVHCP